MKKHTMGTGGGPGAPKNFFTWETWDESYVLLYTQQDANLYLAMIHIWDKLYGFPFVPRTRRDPMPDKCMIDDPVDFEYEEEEEDDCTNNPVLRTPLPVENASNKATATPQSSGKIQSKLAREQRNHVLKYESDCVIIGIVIKI
jgi:hypothetical protein